ncbi:MAG: DUF4330 family protein, partial [Candidatus Omnitrophota bacterium]
NDAVLKQLLAKLKLKIELRDNEIYYKGKPLKIDVPFEFKVNDQIIYATPIILKKDMINIKWKERMLDLFVVFKDLDDSSAKLISVGDKEVDNNGNTLAEILKLGELSHSLVNLDLGEGNYMQGDDSQKKQISLKMRLRCRITDQEIYYKNQRLTKDLPFEFITDKYRAIAVLDETFKEPTKIVQKWLKLNVKFSGAIPEVAKIIQEGDTEKAMDGEVVSRITSIISNKPAEVLTLDKGSFMTLSHPFHKDIIVALEVLCVEKDGILHFKNYPAKIGNNITFSTDLYSISGTIINLEMR